MYAVVGLMVAVSAIFAYNSASGWLYSGDTVSVHDFPGEKLVEQNFDPFNQKAIRKEIHDRLRDSYQYLSMSMYFDQSGVALPGFYKLFKQYSDREMSNAIKWMNYMNLREGSSKLMEIPEPKVEVWKDGLLALRYALKMERKSLFKTETLQKLAVEKHDPHMKQFVEDNFLDQKVKTIKEIGDKMTKLQRYKSEDPGLGLQLFDSSLM